MAKVPPKSPPPGGGKPPPAEGKAGPLTVIKAIKTTVSGWFGARDAELIDRGDQTPARLREAVNGQSRDWDGWNLLDQSAVALLGTTNRQLRARQQIYAEYQDMGADPIITSALALHVTSALGGDPATGKMVFIKPAPAIKGDTQLEALVASVATDLEAILNRAAPQVAFPAVQFGDGYARIYSAPGTGVVDLYTDELVLPPLIQPFERGNRTVGFIVSNGPRQRERISVLQMARMRMPRKLYIPQDRVAEKAWRTMIATDDMRELPAVPALAGGSFLDGTEKAYRQFSASWAGLTAQRIRDSVRQNLVTVQQDGMTRPQRTKLSQALIKVFTATNKYINDMVASGRVPVTELFHFLPVFGEKQMVQLNEKASGATSGASISIEDVMMNARFLAGSLGLDLSMLGFSDQLSGGLGDGGFFRTSAQSAERSRVVRSALAECFDHVIAVHMLMKHKLDFGDQKPWVIQFSGGISAFETEQARTRADKMNATALLVQTMTQLKDSGLDAPAIERILETELGMEAADAKLYAADIAKAGKESRDAQQMGGGGGGFGGGEPMDPDRDGDTGIQPVES